MHQQPSPSVNIHYSTVSYGSASAALLVGYPVFGDLLQVVFLTKCTKLVSFEKPLAVFIYSHSDQQSPSLSPFTLPRSYPPSLHSPSHPPLARPLPTHYITITIIFLSLCLLLFFFPFYGTTLLLVYVALYL